MAKVAEAANLCQSYFQKCTASFGQALIRNKLNDRRLVAVGSPLTAPGKAWQQQHLFSW